MPVSAEQRERFVDRLAEQEQAHDGGALREWAGTVLSELPSGPVELLATSTEGCALAAAVATLRADSAPTRWSRLLLGRQQSVADGYTPVVVEPVELGSGLRDAITAAMPDAMIIGGLAQAAPAVPAAAA